MARGVKIYQEGGSNLSDLKGLTRVLKKDTLGQVDTIYSSLSRDPERAVRWCEYAKQNVDLTLVDGESLAKLKKISEFYEDFTGHKFFSSRKAEKVSPKEVFEKFDTLRDLVTLVSKGYSNSALIFGRGGTGKTVTAKQTLASLDKEYVELRGYVSPVAFYNFLYEHREKLILIDDCDKVFKDNDGLNVLKAVLETHGERHVQWLSPSYMVAIPEFNFSGRVIFLSNLTFEQMSSHLQALISRVHMFNLTLSNDEALFRIRHLAIKTEYKRTTKEQRLRVYRFLKENKDHVPNLNLRHYIKALDLLLYSSAKWRKLFMQCI